MPTTNVWFWVGVVLGVLLLLVLLYQVMKYLVSRGYVRVSGENIPLVTKGCGNETHYLVYINDAEKVVLATRNAIASVGAEIWSTMSAAAKQAQIASFKQGTPHLDHPNVPCYNKPKPVGKGAIAGPARKPEHIGVYNTKFFSEQTKITKYRADIIRQSLGKMQEDVDNVYTSSKVPSSFVDELRRIEETVAPTVAGRSGRNTMVAIAQATMKHYGDCGICAATIGAKPIPLYVPWYGKKWNVYKAVKRSVGWLISECEARGSLNENFASDFEDIRSPKNLTELINNKYLPKCKGNTRIFMIFLYLTGQCGEGDDTGWGAHANQIVFNKEKKTICLNDPNVTTSRLVDNQYIADFIGEQLSDFISEHGYTYEGYCLKDTLKGYHGGTCRYADQMAIFDERVRTNVQLYMQHLVWIVKTMVNMYTTEAGNQGETVPFDAWELNAMTCPQTHDIKKKYIKAPKAWVAKKKKNTNDDETMPLPLRHDEPSKTQPEPNIDELTSDSDIDLDLEVMSVNVGNNILKNVRDNWASEDKKVKQCQEAYNDSSECTKNLATFVSRAGFDIVGLQECSKKGRRDRTVDAKCNSKQVLRRPPGKGGFGGFSLCHRVRQATYGKTRAGAYATHEKWAFCAVQ